MFGFQINMEIVTENNLINKTQCSVLVLNDGSWSRITVLVKFRIPRYKNNIPSVVWVSYEFYIIPLFINGEITFRTTCIL